MVRRAIVIRTIGSAEEKLGCFLDLLGIEWEALTVESFLNEYESEIVAGRENQLCLILSGGCLAELRSELDKRQIPVRRLSKAFTGSLFHSLDHSAGSLRLLGDLLDGARILSAKNSSSPLQYRITDEHPSICGALSGLSFVAAEVNGNRGIDFELSDGTAENIISLNEASLLARVCLGTHEAFISSGAEVLDLRESTSTNIDFRACFSRVVPILVALRHLFRGSCWEPKTHYANIVIDDPPLWPKYGHLDTRELAALLDRTGCACTIAMIPWNYRRSNRRTVSLVADRQPRFGICVHGCDHTKAEFGSRDREKLAGKLLIARRRMEAHEQRTGLRCQPVMVFPQGVFSVEAMACLRPGGYLAAVNTEVADYQREASVTFQDLLSPALLCYNGTPLFTRRRPESGTVNFAIDSFLGKPCLVVLHHDFFKGGIRNLEELVNTLAKFQPRLSWDSLENIARGCAMSKPAADGTKTVRIFADSAVIRIEEGQGEELIILKSETDKHKISRVELNGRSAQFSFENGFMSVNVGSLTDQTVSVRMIPADSAQGSITESSLRERARVAARRYLCEMRDSYQASSERLLRSARAVARSWQKN
jgi:hypothetical protein